MSTPQKKTRTRRTSARPFIATAADAKAWGLSLEFGDRRHGIPRRHWMQLYGSINVLGAYQNAAAVGDTVTVARLQAGIDRRRAIQQTQQRLRALRGAP